MTQILSTKDACELLAVSSPTLEKFRLYLDCPIPFGRIGRRYTYDRSEIHAWIRSNALLDPDRPARAKLDHERRPIATVAGTCRREEPS